MTSKTDTNRLDHVIAAALLLQRSLRNPQGADIGVSTGDVQAHDTGLQRAAEARGHTPERRPASIMGRPYSVTFINLDHVKITLFSRDDSDRDDLGNHPTINTLAVANGIADAAEQAADHEAGVRVDPTPTPAQPFMSEAVPEQIDDDSIPLCPVCKQPAHASETDDDDRHPECAEREAADRRAEEDAAAAHRGAVRMRTIVGLTDADLDPAPDSIGGE